MKVRLGKTLVKGLEAAAGAAAGVGSAGAVFGLPIGVYETSVVAAVAGLLRAIVNVLKVWRKE